MPEEDDEALGAMLGDRLRGASGSADAEPSESVGEEANATDDTKSTGATSSTERAKSTESTQITHDTSGDDGGTTRSRSPFPLYVTPELKQAVQDRFEKFNAQRTLNDEPQVEKHRHFMEGLLRAGLDSDDLEAYVMEEFDEE